MSAKALSLRVRLREATSLAILEAAEQVASEQGLSGSSLQAIAERAGVAVGTIYNYFDDRDQLFNALFTQRREELCASIDTAAHAHARAPFAEQLHTFVHSVLTHFDKRRVFLRIALEAEPRRSAVVKDESGRRRPAMQQLQDRAERVVKVGVREKCVREEGAELFATVLVSILRGVLVVRLDDPKPFASEARMITALFLRGVAR